MGLSADEMVMWSIDRVKSLEFCGRRWVIENGLLS